MGKRRSEKPARAAVERRDSPRRSLRFLVLFSAYVSIGFALLRAPFAQPAVTGATRLVAAASAFLIRVCGGQALADGDLLSTPSAVHSIRVSNGCNGLHVGILLWAAMAAFPAPLAQKLKGLVLNSSALHAMNLVRVISLFYLQGRGGVWFDLAHLYLWEALIVLCVFAMFGLWARGAYSADRGAARRANE
jgi:exosortase H (IPTLxxWG-CTERM-specific)